MAQRESKWRDFIAPFRDAKVFGNAAYKILNDFFKKAGYSDDIPDPTVKSWLSGGRNCRTSDYFPNGTINAERLFQYFRKRRDSVLKDLQQEFRDKEISPDSPIDTKTDDLDVFCWSLVNHFLDLLGLQRVNIPDNLTLPDNESTRAKQLRDKCCACCLHWQGTKAPLGTSMLQTYGNCIVKRKENEYRCQSKVSTSAVCSKYQADPRVIKLLEGQGYNVENLM